MWAVLFVLTLHYSLFSLVGSYAIRVTCSASGNSNLASSNQGSVGTVNVSIETFGLII